MTVFNLALDKKMKEHRVFIHEFAPTEDASQVKKLEIIKNCILGAEWETNELGLKNECTIYGEGLIKDGNKCLFIQTKCRNKEMAEFYVFEEQGMTVNHKGQIEMTYTEKCYRCNFTSVR